MRIDEFAKPMNDQLPFDVVDDVCVYMRNDPMFYRKTFFPAMADVSDKLERGDSIDTKVLMRPLVDKGIKSYCKKYLPNKRPEDVFTSEDVDACCNKIEQEEMPNIKKGIYKCS